MMKNVLVILMCMMCLVCSAAAESEAPLLPDLGAFADGSLTKTEAAENEKGRMISFTGGWQDVKYVVKGYFQLLKDSYDLVEDAHFELEYMHNGEEYDYFVYCFSYNGPEGDTVANMHMGTSSWDISGSDVVICYSQGRAENENVSFGFSKDFTMSDTGERLDVSAVIAAEEKRPLPDIEAYSSGLLTCESAEYWKGGGNQIAYTGAAADVAKVMESYIELLVDAYGMEQTDRFEWEHGHKHIICAFRFTGEDADDMKTMKREYEEIGLCIRRANVMLSYVQGEDGMDSLQLDFFERDFSVKDSGERL